MVCSVGVGIEDLPVSVCSYRRVPGSKEGTLLENADILISVYSESRIDSDTVPGLVTDDEISKQIEKSSGAAT